jgi:hypothetical protein
MHLAKMPMLYFGTGNLRMHQSDKTPLDYFDAVTACSSVSRMNRV